MENTIQQARKGYAAHIFGVSELKKVQRKLDCPRASLGSLSESVSVFEPQRLKPIIEKLGEKLKPLAADKRLKDAKTLTVGAPPSVESIQRGNRDSNLLCDHRLHVDQPLDRSQADSQNVRNGLLVLLRHGRRR